MDYKKTADEIMQNIGGEQNVSSLVHCATRLRFTLKNSQLAKKEVIEKIPGVISVVNVGGQFQVIIGSQVTHVYKAITDKASFRPDNNQDEIEPEKKKVLSVILDTISGIFSPLLPAITACGMLKAFLVILPLIGVLPKESSTYTFLSLVADSAFYFLPIMLAYTSALKFKANPYYAMVIGAFLLHPNFAAIVKEGTEVTFYGLPVKLVSYGSSVIPIILSILVMSYIERFADRISPNAIKFFFKPLIVFLIMAPITFIVIGPLGMLLGEGLSFVIYGIQDKIGWAAIMLMAIVMPFIVMVGMHKAFIPVMIASLANPGYEMLIIPAMLASNLAQGASAVAVSRVTKNPELRQLAASSGITALLAGITEPALYGVTLKHKKALIGALIGAGCAGFYAGITHVFSYAYATPAILSLPQWVGGETNANIINALIAATISIVVSFTATTILFKDKTTLALEPEGVKGADQNPIDSDGLIFSPITGDVVELAQVNDPAFSTEAMGKGIAIIPSTGRVVSPFKGTVATISKTKHAIAIVSEDGIEVLIHVGMDTVKLKGEHFVAHAKQGDQVNVGDLLLEFDLDKIKAAGFDTITPIIVTNTSNYEEIISLSKDKVKEKAELIKVVKEIDSSNQST